MSRYFLKKFNKLTILYCIILMLVVTLLFIVFNNDHKVKTPSGDWNVEFEFDNYIKITAIVHGEHEYLRNGFNQISSDKLPLNRAIPDTRHHWCQKIAWNSEQYHYPDASVVITFYNEARSTLLRTIVSVLNRTPSALLREVIIVDDYSDNPGDGFGLAMMKKIRVLRNSRREGLIRSRLRGAAAAQGHVLVFLDSHCEVNADWLQPLLLRILKNRTNVVSPVMDVIDHDDFSYKASAMNAKGVFDWRLELRWDFLSLQELAARQRNPIQPIRTPMIGGGLFAIERERFEEIGTYDEEMEVWGGENLELSLRVWMCHGSLLIEPCSRVGHVFRQHHPYGSGANFTVSDAFYSERLR